MYELWYLQIFSTSHQCQLCAHKQSIIHYTMEKSFSFWKSNKNKNIKISCVKHRSEQKRKFAASILCEITWQIAFLLSEIYTYLYMYNNNDDNKNFMLSRIKKRCLINFTGKSFCLTWYYTTQQQKSLILSNHWIIKTSLSSKSCFEKMLLIKDFIIPVTNLRLFEYIV